MVLRFRWWFCVFGYVPFFFFFFGRLRFTVLRFRCGLLFLVAMFAVVYLIQFRLLASLRLETYCREKVTWSYSWGEFFGLLKGLNV